MLKFLKEIKKNDLFPGEIQIGVSGGRDLYTGVCNELNKRKKEVEFVRRVSKRITLLSSVDRKLRPLLLELFKIFKSYGVEIKENEYTLTKATVEVLTKKFISNLDDILHYGIEMKCFELYKKKSKTYICLISENLDTCVPDEQLLAGKIFRIMKENGVMNEQGKYVCKEESIRKIVKGSNAEFYAALNLAETHGCIRSYEIEENKYFVLVSEKFQRETFVPNNISAKKDEDIPLAEAV